MNTIDLMCKAHRAGRAAEWMSVLFVDIGGHRVKVMFVDECEVLRGEIYDMALSSAYEIMCAALYKCGGGFISEVDFECKCDELSVFKSWFERSAEEIRREANEGRKTLFILR